MLWLVLGVLVWSAFHLLPSAGVSARSRLLNRMGEPAYKGTFALAIVLSVVLIVIGWRSTTPVWVYAGPAWGRWVTNLGMCAALVLFAASVLPTNLKRVVRHPQLIGVATWAAAHLLSNGEQRSVILFGGIELWALLAIAFINRRDGAWEKPEPQPMTAELKLAALAIVAFAALFFLHPYFAGMPPAP